MIDQKIEKFAVHALRASLFVEPCDYGLTFDELLQLGQPRDIKRGELEDTINTRQQTRFIQLPNSRIWLSQIFGHDMILFYGHCSDDPRNIDAFEYIWQTFCDLDREVGSGKGRIPRNTLVARSKERGINEHDVIVAIETYIAFEEMILTEDSGAVLRSGKITTWAGQMSPKRQRAKNSKSSVVWGFQETKDLMGPVKDIISRRTDGRLQSIEPIGAFEKMLIKLNVPRLAPWWNQVSSELAISNDQTSPTTVIVLAAALGEAALCCVMERVKIVGGTMTLEVWNQEPRTWKFITLIKEAKKGDDPIFNADIGARASRLNDLRQRIHAARYWPDKPARFDLRPEEAREARETLDRLLRAILEWIEKHPIK